MSEIIEKGSRENYIIRLFDSIAPYYDSMNSLISWGLIRKWQLFLVEKVNPQRDSTILDVCTGTGDVALLLAEYLDSGGEVVGVDISSKMLSIARNKLKRQKPQARITLNEGNILNLPFPQESFDGVTISLALRNVEDIQGAVKEMVRVCRKEGRVVCLEISRPSSFIVRQIFNLYFDHLIPLLGRIVDKGKNINDRPPAYTWLSLSLRGFPQGEKMVEIFKGAGLKNVRYYPLNWGIVTVYVGVKY